MPAQARILPQRKERRVNVPRFKRGQAQTVRRRVAQDRVHQVLQTITVVASVGTDVDPSEDDFAIPLPDQVRNLSQDRVARPAALLAAQHVHDAVRTCIVTAILDLDHWPRTWAQRLAAARIRSRWGNIPLFEQLFDPQYERILCLVVNAQISRQPVVPHAHVAARRHQASCWTAPLHVAQPLP